MKVLNMLLLSRFKVFVFLCMALLFPASAQAQVETPIRVTVLAADAKFIGTSMGGAQITIRDKVTGDTLASGRTSGGTGDTKKIMTPARQRDAVLVDPDTASLDISLDLPGPIHAVVTATGPMAQMQSAFTVSQDILLIPGKDYSTGNGIMLTLPGFVVDVMSPPAGQRIPFEKDMEIIVTANVTKLCGCAIAEGSPWNPGRYEVEIASAMDYMSAGSTKMTYAGKPGQYAAKMKFPEPGTYTFTVTAFDPVTKEGGVDTTTIILAAPEKAN